MNKKQILFLVLVVVAVICFVGFFVSREKQGSYDSDFKENDQKNTVVYDEKEYRYNEHLSNFLFIGIDSREPVTEFETHSESARADAIFLLSYDRVKKIVKCVSIPRDTIANVRVLSVDGTDMGISKEHINMQYAFGDGKEESCRLMMETVSNLLYSIPIQGYCSLNMDGIAILADALEGIPVTIPDESLEELNSEFVKGATITLTRDNVEQFVRYRDTNESHSALVRTNRQKVFLKALVERAKEKGADESSLLVEMYDSLKPYMITNIGNDILAKLMEADYDSETGIIDIPGEGVAGDIYDEYHVDETRLYELVLQLFYKDV